MNGLDGDMNYDISTDKTLSSNNKVTNEWESLKKYVSLNHLNNVRKIRTVVNYV